MEIHLVSSLTPEDERRLAPMMVAAIGRMLDRLPVTYALRIETTTGVAIQHSRTAPQPDEAPAGLDEQVLLAPLPFPQAPVTILDRD